MPRSRASTRCPIPLRSRRALVGLLGAAMLFTTSGCSSTPDEPTTSAAPASWIPSKPLSVPSMSTSEMMAVRETLLSDQAEQMGLGNPAIPALVRWTLPEEQLMVMQTCLVDKEFTVSLSNGGTGIQASIAPNQQSAYDLAFWQCDAMYSVDARLSQLPSDAEMVGHLWDYWDEFVIGCLAANGHPARRELPSRQVFAGDDSWFIQQAYPDITDDAESTRLQRACPPTPPSSLLLGQGWKPTGS